MEQISVPNGGAESATPRLKLRSVCAQNTRQLHGKHTPEALPKVGEAHQERNT
jgi:hypothetical protein